jgi:hypothetical protein
MSNLQTFLANLSHAAWNHETISVGGGEFDAKALLASFEGMVIYKYRNLPCTAVDKDEKGLRWCVNGEDKLGGAGVLEWCYHYDDANCVMVRMKKFGHFENLSIGKF